MTAKQAKKSTIRIWSYLRDHEELASAIAEFLDLLPLTDVHLAAYVSATLIPELRKGLTALRSRPADAAIMEALREIAATEQREAYDTDMLKEGADLRRILDLQTALRRCGDLARAALVQAEGEKT